MSSFVGRDHDVRAVRDQIAQHRLVTLTGPGGSGKTRLSVEVGRAETRSEVWWVELAPVTDPAEVPQAASPSVRETTRASEASGKRQTSLRGRMGTRTLRVSSPRMVRSAIGAMNFASETAIVNPARRLTCSVVMFASELTS